MENGFTLLELLVVLAIVSLLLAIVPPSLPNVLEGAQLRGAQRELIGGLRLARSRAVSAQREVTFTLNVQDRTMRIADENHLLNLPDGAALTLVSAQREQLSEHAGAIRFYPDGSSTGGRIRLRQGERTSSIDVNWLTGRITSAGE